MYQLPNYNFKKTKENLPTFVGLALLIFVLIFSVFYSGAIPGDFLKNIDGLLKNPGVQETSRLNEAPDNKYVSDISYEQAIINVVKSAAPSVVSIVVFKNTPVYQEQLINPFGDDSPFNIKIPQYVQRGSELKEVGGASGFIVSSDGLVLTNKHVVLDDKAQYTVIGSDGKKYDAKVLALDPVQDLAILKIEGSGFEAIKLGNSDNIEVGQGAIAIGNSLGKFSNTVSVGIVSGLERTIDASTQTGDFYETLEGIIQTDAAINQGNSGGPLLNLKGEVIGVNVATAQGAQTIGFAIPINLAKRDIEQVVKTNKISYPFLGVRYILVTDKVKKEYKLSVDYGALVKKGESGEPAVTSGSGADKAGIKDGDVILEINGQKITENNSLANIIAKYSPSDELRLKVLRDGNEMDIQVILGERS